MGEKRRSQERIVRESSERPEERTRLLDVLELHAEDAAEQHAVFQFILRV